MFETFYDKVWTETESRSVLVGAIWQVDHDLSLDAAYRYATVNGRAVNEIRAGLTFAFKVNDNGIGLPAEHRHRLTEPYVTTRAKGTGLGLAIVRKIMEDHGGEIALGDGEGGEGAEVTLTFPFMQRNMRQKGIEDEQKRIADRV